MWLAHRKRFFNALDFREMVSNSSFVLLCSSVLFEGDRLKRKKANHYVVVHGNTTQSNHYSKQNVFVSGKAHKRHTNSLIAFILNILIYFEEPERNLH